MMDELLGLIKDVRRFVKMANAWMERDLAKEGISLPGELPLGAAKAEAPVADAPKVPVKSRAAKKAPVAAPEAVPVDPFEMPAAPPVRSGPEFGRNVTAEEEVEARRRCQEVMGLFIRRYLKAVPPGLDRAKSILSEVCGRHVGKLEDLSYHDNVKLIPRFEKELEGVQ